MRPPHRSVALERSDSLCDPPLVLNRRNRLRATLGLALVVILATSTDLSSAGVNRGTAPFVVQLGKRVGPWVIGGRYKRAAGLIRSELHPENADGGCIAGPITAVRIDYYRGMRLSWVDFYKGGLGLIDAATTRVGDHTSKGLVIGRHTLRDARRLYPQADLRAQRDAYDLGSKTLTAYRSTGEEAGIYLIMWFDTADRLVALQTGTGGC